MLNLCDLMWCVDCVGVYVCYGLVCGLWVLNRKWLLLVSMCCMLCSVVLMLLLVSRYWNV